MNTNFIQRVRILIETEDWLLCVYKLKIKNNKKNERIENERWMKIPFFFLLNHESDLIK